MLGPVCALDHYTKVSQLCSQGASAAFICFRECGCIRTQPVGAHRLRLLHALRAELGRLIEAGKPETFSVRPLRAKASPRLRQTLMPFLGLSWGRVTIIWSLVTCVILSIVQIQGEGGSQGSATGARGACAGSRPPFPAGRQKGLVCTGQPWIPAGITSESWGHPL